MRAARQHGPPPMRSSATRHSWVASGCAPCWVTPTATGCSQTYAGQVPAEADLVCYWVARAAAAVTSRTTWSRRPGDHKQHPRAAPTAGCWRRSPPPARSPPAWADEPWTLDGTAVRVSLVCWGRDRALAPQLDGKPVATIHADLTGGGANLTGARRPAGERGGGIHGGHQGRGIRRAGRPRAAVAGDADETPTAGRTRTCSAPGPTAWT